MVRLRHGLIAAVVALAAIPAFATPAVAQLSGACTATGTLVKTGRTYDAKIDNSATIPREVTARIQTDLNFSAAVTLVEPGTIASEGKTRRVIRT